MHAAPAPHDLDTLPLSGVRVLDFTHVIAGPFATMMLANMGADVVKVERIGGEPLRHIPGFKGRDGHPDYFNAVNVSKRGIALDLKPVVPQPEPAQTAKPGTDRGFEHGIAVGNL